jgi:hypothetical protein
MAQRRATAKIASCTPLAIFFDFGPLGPIILLAILAVLAGLVVFCRSRRRCTYHTIVLAPQETRKQESSQYNPGTKCIARRTNVASWGERVLAGVTKLLWAPPIFQSFCRTRVLFASGWHQRDRASRGFFYYPGIVLRCDDRQGSGNKVRTKRAAHVSFSGQPSEFTLCENNPHCEEP